MKFNMGCGFNKISGYINIDRSSEADPDLIMNLEELPWEIDSESADEVLFNHCLEHLGRDPEVFSGIMKELYRICKPDARIHIHVPHPRHDDFLNDPTHVRIITPDLLNLFSKKLNQHWKEAGNSNTPLATYINVDFETVQSTMILEDTYYRMYLNNEITENDLMLAVKERNNIVKEYQIILKAVK